MINKKLILSLLPILAIGALASCAGKPGPESDDDSVPESQPDSESGETQKTNISIWTTLSYQTQLENMIASFEEANPNIQLELFDDALHGMSYLVDENRYRKIVNDFIDEVLKEE